MERLLVLINFLFHAQNEQIVEYGSWGTIRFLLWGLIVLLILFWLLMFMVLFWLGWWATRVVIGVDSELEVLLLFGFGVCASDWYLNWAFAVNPQNLLDPTTIIPLLIMRVLRTIHFWEGSKQWIILWSFILFFQPLLAILHNTIQFAQFGLIWWCEFLIKFVNARFAHFYINVQESFINEFLIIFEAISSG